ncbi:MAG: Loki-CTERM sorting domain-containing protein [Candidatus Helarchaeales archaeon]
MKKNTMTVLSACIFFLIMTFTPLMVIVPGFAWNNGDPGDYYYGVRFGSHDWIADHAMNMLPSEDRSWYDGIYRTYFLIGTEAPDNSSIDIGDGLVGYGDTGLHHNYYQQNHSGVVFGEDDASIRCQQEYDKAKNAVQEGNLKKAAFYAGAMTHYLADLAVWGHVMGTNSPHGTEVHHSDFEGSANTRMDDPAESYFTVTFDGEYNTTISAYQASYEMGLETDSNGTDGTNPGEQYDCEWLDANYHAFTVPIDDDFERRCQDLINLAVNLLADLLYQLFHGANFSDMDIAWDTKWNASSGDFGYGVTASNNGSVYAVGSTDKAGNYDQLMIQYDSSGQEQKNLTWGGGGFDEVYDAAINASGFVHVVGVRTFSASDANASVTIFDSSSNLVEYFTWGNDNLTYGDGIALDNYNNIYVSGHIQDKTTGCFDLFVAKFNPAGNEIWNFTLGDSNVNEYGIDIVLDSNNNSYVVGRATTTIEDLILVKIDGQGNKLWNLTWGGTSSDRGFGIALDAEGKVVVTGQTKSYGAGQEDVIIQKYSTDGTLLWNKTWGGTLCDIGYAVTVDSNNDIYVGGYTSSYGLGNFDGLLLKFDSSGTLLWDLTFGTVGDDRIESMVLVNGDTLYLSGYSDPTNSLDYDAWLIKLVSQEDVSDNPPTLPNNPVIAVPGFEWTFLLGIIGIISIFFWRVKKRK